VSSFNGIPSQEEILQDAKVGVNGQTVDRWPDRRP